MMIRYLVTTALAASLVFSVAPASAGQFVEVHDSGYGVHRHGGYDHRSRGHRHRRSRARLVTVCHVHGGRYHCHDEVVQRRPRHRHGFRHDHGADRPLLRFLFRQHRQHRHDH